MEAQQLLESLRGHRLEALWLVMLTIGLRPGEAAGLTWADLDLESGRVTVRHSLQRKNSRPQLVDSLKTERSRRTIALPAITVEALRRHRIAQAAERLAASAWKDDRLVFASTSGYVLEPRSISRQFSKATEAAGLGHWTPNELRHSAASLLSDAGVPLERVADLLGHTNTRMLERTYRHSAQPAIDAAAPMAWMLSDEAATGEA